MSNKSLAGFTGLLAVIAVVLAVMCASCSSPVAVNPVDTTSAMVTIKESNNPGFYTANINPFTCLLVMLSQTSHILFLLFLGFRLSQFLFQNLNCSADPQKSLLQSVDFILHFTKLVASCFEFRLQSFQAGL